MLQVVSVFRERCACTNADVALAIACRPYAAEFVQSWQSVCCLLPTRSSFKQAFINAGHSAHTPAGIDSSGTLKFCSEPRPCPPTITD